MESVPRTTGVMTELLRRITVPQVGSEESTQRVQLMHQVLCRKLEPTLRQAVSVLQQMEGLESDRLAMLQRGDYKKADEILEVINKLLESVETIGKERPGGVRGAQHSRGFCAAVSASPAKGKRCLPSVSRNKTPTTTPSKLVMTRTGLSSTPTATSTQRSRDLNLGRSGRKFKSASRPTSQSQVLRSPSRSINAIETMQLETPLTTRTTPSLSPQRPVTPMHQHQTFNTLSGPASSTTSPRRDREFILALLRSLQLEEHAPLFGDMSLLSFYRLTLSQLQQLGLPEAAQATLYNSIDQIKHIADSTLSPARSVQLT
eukprot:TRINITY_DN5466_c0_g1_i1.p1 TRINITY_DN5466_c0_g1~~TRINITY_DN5466_c0_g1_i1.p1  ORF type:complete len:317 (+),score=44.37 TRINITY_DN5466_c0_g1_i1:52-1002(+)